MVISLRKRLSTGETRPWTGKEFLQGKPLGHPSHPMLVHFPVAFYIGTLGLDILSKVGDFPAAPVATTWLLIGAFTATVLAALTGLVDRSTTPRGSRTRGAIDRHMWFQLFTGALFVVNFIVRWPDRHLAEAKPLWLILDVIGVGTLTVGQYLGGRLVYGLGFRVGEESGLTAQD